MIEAGSKRTEELKGGGGWGVQWLLGGDSIGKFYGTCDFCDFCIFKSSSTDFQLTPSKGTSNVKLSNTVPLMVSPLNL